MRKIGIAFAAAALVATALTAQTVHDEIAFTRAQIAADRQTVVAATLKLNEAQAKDFWPIYREYRGEVAKPLDRLWNLFETYGKTWDAMSDADAAKLLDEYFAIEKDIVQIKQKYAKTMTARIGAANTARFFQIDNKLDSIVRAEAASGIPLLTKAK